MRAEIGRYTSINGVPAASAVFSNKLGVKVSKSMVNMMKKAYLLVKKRRSGSESVSTLSSKKRGRPILGAHLDKQV
jgi:hypothetical protein